MDVHSRPILFYRWIVFLLAAGYVLYQIGTNPYTSFGGPFRFLTIWALFLSFYAASRMLAFSEYRTTQRHEVTATVASVFNVMVCYLYWKLWLTDPSLVNSSGPPVWHQEYYLHLVGPALQIVDAAFIGRVYQRVHRAALPIVAIVALYVVWIEGLVARFSTHPSGTVVSGLPYPFLNNMEIAERATFYGLNAAMGLGLLVVFGLLGWGLRRVGFKPTLQTQG